VADEAVVGEDAAQVEVALEDDAVQVEGLALEPVGRTPDSVTEATAGRSSSGANTFRRTRQLCVTDSRCDTTQ
jgi:hypothetical protein